MTRRQPSGRSMALALLRRFGVPYSNRSGMVTYERLSDDGDYKKVHHVLAQLRKRGLLRYLHDAKSACARLLRCVRRPQS